jgi:hypothetical protein
LAAHNKLQRRGAAQLGSKLVGVYGVRYAQWEAWRVSEKGNK